MRVGRRAPSYSHTLLWPPSATSSLLSASTVGGKYLSVFLLVSGVYSGNGLVLTWSSETIASLNKRNTVLAMQICFVNGSACSIRTTASPLDSRSSGRPFLPTAAPSYN